MDYGFKPTTHGRELLAACAATGKGLDISRVAVGSGTLPEGVDLADVHALYNYVADGAVSQRTHENDRLYLTVQYSNASPDEHKALPSFTLAEFMVYAIHPETGEETDLLYGTLGSYLQPVPAYNTAFPASVFSLPLTIIVSDEVEVTVSATAGLVTYDDLNESVEQAVKNATEDIGGIVYTIPFTIAPTDWVNDGDGTHPAYADIVDARIKASHIPAVVFDDDSLDTTADCGVSTTSESYSGYVRIKAKTAATANLTGTLYLIGKATGSGGGGDYELPIATDTTLGGVKIKDGGGLKIDGLGNLELDAATGQDVQDLYDATGE